MKDATGNIFPLGNDNINQINLNPTIRIDSPAITPKQPVSSYLLVDRPLKTPFFEGREAGFVLIKQNMPPTRLPESFPEHENTFERFLAALKPGLTVKPRKIENFTGREDELAFIKQRLQLGCVVTLCGPGGIGKSALATEAVRQLMPGDGLPDQFPDGIIWHDFYEEPKVEQAVEHIARWFSYPASGKKSKTGKIIEYVARVFSDQEQSLPLDDAVKRMLLGRKVLLVLDGAERTENLEKMIDIAANCGVLITTQNNLQESGESQEIVSFNSENAIKLLKKWAKEYADDEIALRRICELLEGFPLAIALAGRVMHAKKISAAKYLERLKQTPLQMLVLDPQGGRRMSVPRSLTDSLKVVGTEASRVLSIAGALAQAPFSREVMAEAIAHKTNSGVVGQIEQMLAWKPGEQHVNQIDTVLDTLVAYGLLNRLNEGYKVSHALIYYYAKKKLPVKKETVRWLAAYYTGLLKKECESGEEGFRRLDPERAHIMTMLLNCLDREEWKAVLELFETVKDYLWSQGYSTNLLTAAECGLQAARQLHDTKKEAGCLLTVGDAQWKQEEYEAARQFYEQALAITREICDRRGEGESLRKLGLVFTDLEQMEQATAFSEQTLAIAREIGDRDEEGKALGNLGYILFQQGNFEEAIAVFQQQTEVTPTHEQAWDYLGVVLHNQGRYEEAIAAYQQQTEVTPTHEQAWDHLGLALENQGRYEDAIAAYQQQTEVTPTHERA
ncbi:MAG: tetratricopeptide repeat protein, partial [Gammaproteobacteria bacterium]|nr:tetratricopeptide repeat protein [Gammaproteobacteria bacterium]